MTAVVVRKSPPVVVKPSALPPAMAEASSITLSCFDVVLETMPSTFFFMFDRPIREPAETVKSALSRALVHYYPFAGRLAVGADDGKLCIRCTGEGVLFVAASADCAVKDLEFLDRSLPAAATPAMLHELAPKYPAASRRCRRADPLLMVQVTEFTCGGFVVGTTRNHAVCDASGMGQFMQAVGELTRGLPAPTVAPVRHHGSLSLPPAPAAPAAATQGDELPPPPETMSSLDITIPSSLIDGIKAKFSDAVGGGGGQPCTVFEAVAAVLWRCRTRATMADMDTDTPTSLAFTANVRKHVGAKAGYYGNLVSHQAVVATAGEVANGELTDIVKMIKRVKEEIPNKLFKDKDDKEGGGDRGDRGHGAAYNNLVLSSMRTLGLDKVDLGGGTPARVMMGRVPPQILFPVCAACMPWEGKDGANVLSRCVREEHAAAFLAELARCTA